MKFADFTLVDQTRSFVEILESRVKKDLTPRENINFHSGKEYAHLAYLLGNIKYLTPTPSLAKTYGHPRKRIRPPHSLSEKQKNAYHQLKEWAKDLPSGFTMRELKRAFRQAAHATHPDRGGSVESFLQAQNCFNILEKVFSELDGNARA